MNNALSPQGKNRRKLLSSGFVSLLFIPSLLLSSMNFGNKYFYFLFFCFAVLFLLGLPSFRVNGMVLVLFGISISYLLFNPDSAYSVTGFIKQFVYPLSYICGLNCLRQFERSKKGELTDKEYGKIQERGFLLLCFVIALGILVHVILNLYANPDPSDRTIIDFWTGNATSATGNAALLCFGVGMIPALLVNKSGLFGKIFAVVSLAISVVFALILAGRTFFLLFAIVFFATVLFSAYLTRKAKKAVRIIVICAVAVGIFVLLFSNNAFGLQDAFTGSNFYDRFFGEHANIELNEDGRLERKRMFFDNMFYWENLWGGGALRAASNGKFAHELYLDLLSDAGIIAYVLVIVFVFSRTIRAVKFAFSRESGIAPVTAAIIFGLFLSLNIEFLIEPIIQGMPWLFPTFCLLCGMLDYLIDHKRKEAEK